MTVIGGTLEVCGVGLVFPYVVVLQHPEKITATPYLREAYSALGFASYKTFGVFLSIGMLVLFAVKGSFAVLLNRLQMRFVYSKQLDLGQKLLSGYLYQPYSFFLSTNTSTLIGNLTTSLNQLCGGVIQAALALATEIVIAAGLVGFLLWLSPVFALLAVLFVGGIALLFMRVVKTRIKFYAQENDFRWKAMIRLVNEGLSSAKELQVLGRQDFFVDGYADECRRFSSAMGKYSILMQLPRVFLETLAGAGLVVFAVFALFSAGFEKDLLPLLAVFAIATVRIVPSANRILQALNGISFYSPSIEIIRQGLKGGAAERKLPEGSCDPKLMQRTIRISVRSFVYPTNPSFCLHDINLEIVQGQSVAFIGHSGSGKTTLVDLLLGLFPDFEGEILVDGTDIRENVARWRKCIGYIPQSIYLSDNTITQNVAFGVPDREIDMKKVERAINLAGLEAVVRSQACGLQTVVGDRGVRLSGGERQRIGIARALYHDPDLLVLDEATSALDNETERQVVDSILGLGRTKTIIVIAHRLTSVENCDCLYLMESGRVIDQGRFPELAARHPNFVHPLAAIRPDLGTTVAATSSA
jgi:ATP-binding cassette subfamily C protein